MTDLLERFEHETGIATRLVATDGPIRLSRGTCTELVRILREALANVRRHSGAGHVFVWLRADRESYTLTIEDDGCGFASVTISPVMVGAHLARVAGSIEPRPVATQAAQSSGDSWPLCAEPAAIAESARAIGAGLTVRSSPGKGTRIEVIVHSAYATALPAHGTPGKLVMAKAGRPRRALPLWLSGGRNLQ
jgi:hypothetical protein